MTYEEVRDRMLATVGAAPLFKDSERSTKTTRSARTEASYPGDSGHGASRGRSECSCRTWARCLPCIEADGLTRGSLS